MIGQIRQRIFDSHPVPGLDPVGSALGIERRLDLGIRQSSPPDGDIRQRAVVILPRGTDGQFVSQIQISSPSCGKLTPAGFASVQVNRCLPIPAIRDQRNMHPRRGLETRGGTSPHGYALTGGGRFVAVIPAKDALPCQIQTDGRIGIFTVIKNAALILFSREAQHLGFQPGHEAPVAIAETFALGNLDAHHRFRLPIKEKRLDAAGISPSGRRAAIEAIAGSVLHLRTAAFMRRPAQQQLRLRRPSFRLNEGQHHGKEHQGFTDQVRLVHADINSFEMLASCGQPCRLVSSAIACNRTPVARPASPSCLTSCISSSLVYL
ncbi:MAG: hypothetical protein WCG79_07685 [Verrucomicrobiota bacterium]